MLYKKNMDQIEARYKAFWKKENFKGHIVSIIGTDEYELEYKENATLEERWMDVDFMLKKTEKQMENTYFGADAFPVAFPDLGPDQFAGFYGTNIIFGETTSWAEHNISNPDAFPGFNLDKTNTYYLKLYEMLRAMTEAGKDKYIVGIPDLHPGADGLVSMRGPENLCYDTIENSEFIQKGMMKLLEGFKEVYDDMFKLTGKYQKGTSNWMGIWHPGRFYVTSCDFCCMVSPDMFEEFIVRELIEELEFLDASMFHLDGPGALKHLDRLLQIEQLDGIQWVYGAGEEPAPHWIPIIEKIQRAGKCVQIDVEAADLKYMLEHTKPEGMMFKVYADSVQQAKELEKMVYEFQGNEGRWG